MSLFTGNPSSANSKSDEHGTTLNVAGSDVRCVRYCEGIIGIRPASIGFRSAPPEEICRVVIELEPGRFGQNLGPLIGEICRRHKASRFRCRRHFEATPSFQRHVLVVDLERTTTDRSYEISHAAGTPVVGRDLDW
jgi:hypothetical protein